MGFIEAGLEDQGEERRNATKRPGIFESHVGHLVLTDGAKATYVIVDCASQLVKSDHRPSTIDRHLWMAFARRTPIDSDVDS